MAEEWRWKNFTDAELRCKHCGEAGMYPSFLDRLQQIRDEYGKPIVISSAYRCPIHNAAVSSTGEAGPHTTGKAVDVKIFGASALELTRIALANGITGLGVNQNGPVKGRFLHLDSLAPRLWSY